MLTHLLYINDKKIPSEKKDLSIQTYKILSLVKVLNGKFGAGTYVNILKGSNAKNMEYHKDLDSFGGGKEYSVTFWKELIRILINNEYLKEVQIAKKFGTTIECTKKSVEWLAKINKYDFVSCDNIKDNDKLIFNISDVIKSELNTDIKKENLTTSAANHNAKWTKDQEQQLLDKVGSGEKIKNISTELGRTSSSISSRLKHIACRLYKEGTPLEEISNVTKITQDKILDEYKRRLKPDNKTEEGINEELFNELFDNQPVIKGLKEIKNKIIVKGKKVNTDLRKKSI